MPTAFSTEALEWLSQSIGTAVRSDDVLRMKGSTSSSVYLVHCSRGLDPNPVVLRVFDNHEWLSREPDLPDHEACALVEAQKAAIRSPRLIAYSSTDIGFGAPVLVMSFIKGSIELRPSNFHDWLNGLARQLASIHQHAATGFPWPYRSWLTRDLLAPPEWTLVPRVWDRAIELVLGTPPDTQPPVFIHRDYHPTNVLWHRGIVSGVVDWINACQGPAGVDVAHCRTNLAMMFGPEAADQFLNIYTQVAEGFEYHPYWDVNSILELCIPQPVYYRPWQDFGLSVIPTEVLQNRIDKHLERVMMGA